MSTSSGRFLFPTPCWICDRLSLPKKVITDILGKKIRETLVLCHADTAEGVLATTDNYCLCLQQCNRKSATALPQRREANTKADDCGVGVSKLNVISSANGSGSGNTLAPPPGNGRTADHKIATLQHSRLRPSSARTVLRPGRVRRAVRHEGFPTLSSRYYSGQGRKMRAQGAQSQVKTKRPNDPDPAGLGDAPAVPTGNRSYHVSQKVL